MNEPQVTAPSHHAMLRTPTAPTQPTTPTSGSPSPARSLRGLQQSHLAAIPRRPCPSPYASTPLRRIMSVSDKTAVVTGAGSERGIGRATAHALAAAGWNVAILDLDEASAKDAATDVAERHGVQAVGVGCDITDAASVEAALAVVAPPSLGRGAGQQRGRHLTGPVPRGHRGGVGAHVRGQRPRLLQRDPPARSGMVERGFGRIVFLPRSPRSAAAASSAASPTRRRRRLSSGSPARWPVSWATASPSTRSLLA